MAFDTGARPKNIRLLRGDCLEVMSRLDAASVDLVLCDPPYGTTACKWDAVIPFEPMWEQLKRIAKPNAAIVLTGEPAVHECAGDAAMRTMFRLRVGLGKSKANGPFERQEASAECVNMRTCLCSAERRPAYTPANRRESQKPTGDRLRSAHEGQRSCYGAHNLSDHVGGPPDKSMPRTVLTFDQSATVAGQSTQPRSPSPSWST